MANQIADSASDSAQRIELARRLSQAIRHAALALSEQRSFDSTLVGSCCVHAGLELMLREFPPGTVAAWLQQEADDLANAGTLAMLAPSRGSA